MGFNVPDKLYKLFIVIGILLFYISNTEINAIKESKFKKEVELFSYEDTLKMLEIQSVFDKEELIQKASDYSILNNSKNPLQFKDSLIEYKYILKGPDSIIKNQIMLDKQWETYNKTKQKITFFEVKKHNFKKQLDKFSEYYKGKINFQYFLLISGGLLFLVGVLAWLNDDIMTETNKKKN